MTMNISVHKKIVTTTTTTPNNNIKHTSSTIKKRTSTTSKTTTNHNILYENEDESITKSSLSKRPRILIAIIAYDLKNIKYLYKLMDSILYDICINAKLIDIAIFASFQAIPHFDH